ncbi:ABC transporter substrate-binding protein [Bordetella sp. N]|uniref:ABC transporter substrate-binding protein n=1 Tax=Bordetella sp. N TaxID=1746199 RepID=UPI000709C3C7|nr:ABC transporter substrate-binding protein [Bordetella sp. N]ALM83136.1 peptide ABC transporter substrate-binding protein [Bordetella sp. N]
MRFERRTFLKLVSAGVAATWDGLAPLGLNTAVAAPALGARREGGELTFLIDNLDTGWGPNEKIDNFTGVVWGQIADKLVYVDEKGQPTPWIAERWDENAQQTEFTLHLKHGVTFSDGSAVDARTVAANIDFWAKGDPSRGIARLGLFPSEHYQGAVAVDDHTVRVTFSSPTLSFIGTLGYHKTVLKTLASINLKTEELGDLGKQVGSGPFTVASWRQGDSVVLVKRKDYNWGPAAIGHQGAASLDRITFKVVRDPSLRAAAVEAGQAEVAFNVSPQELRPLKAKGLKVTVPEALGFTGGYRVNTQTPHFDDVRLRRAIQHAIDRKEILNTVFTDDWKLSVSLLQSNVPEAVDLSKLFAYDPDTSRRLLDEAGWKAGKDGFRTKDGQKLEFKLYASPWVSTSRQVGEVVSQQLQQVGINAALQVVDVPTFNARVRNNNSVPFSESSRSFLDAGVVGSALTNAHKGDDWFKLGQSDATLNRLAEAITTAADRKQRAQLLADAQRYVIEQGLFIPIVELVQRLYVQTPRLQGEAYGGAGYVLYHGAWLGQEG